jgi:hypothetical protein
MISQEGTSVSSDTNQTTEGEANPFEPLTSYLTANSTAMINNGSLLASFFIFLYIVWKFRVRRPPKHSASEASFQAQAPHGGSPYTIGSGSVRPIHSGVNVTSAVKHEILKSPETAGSVHEKSEPRTKTPKRSPGKKTPKRSPGKKTPKETHGRWENA